MNVATADPTLPDEITDRARQLGPLESPLIWWTLAGRGGDPPPQTP